MAESVKPGQPTSAHQTAPPKTEILDTKKSDSHTSGILPGNAIVGKPGKLEGEGEVMFLL